MTDLSQRVRKSEAKRLALGQRQIKVWVPDTPEDIAAVRVVAKALCDSASSTDAVDNAHLLANSPHHGQNAS